jgi:hypothetical protein
LFDLLAEVGSINAVTGRPSVSDCDNEDDDDAAGAGAVEDNSGPDGADDGDDDDDGDGDGDVADGDGDNDVFARDRIRSCLVICSLSILALTLPGWWDVKGLCHIIASPYATSS